MKNFARRLGLSLTLVLLAAVAVTWWQRQALYDWWRLRNYSPPPAIVALANADTMTDPARHLFYVNHPRLVSQLEAFRQHCPTSELTIVLGCYQPPQAGIYIYDVSDNRLTGIEEVTAAHEMLHGAYDRLSPREKRYIDDLLVEYAKNLTDQRIIDTIAAYRRSEPRDVINEMHSVFGTEAVDLPAALENYYKRYFVDRSKVVSLANGYEAEFSRRIDLIESYDAQLSDLKQSIKLQEQDLDAQLTQIQAERSRLQSLRASGQIEAYNAAVPAYNFQVNAYNQSVAKLRSDIERYNQLVIVRNQVANELRDLDQAIDTRLTTQPIQ